MVLWIPPEETTQKQASLRLQNPLARMPWHGTFPTSQGGVGKSLTC